MSQEKFDRFVEAYEMMALRGKYRPAAPGNGMGGIALTNKELKDLPLLREEAKQFAHEVYAEDEDALHLIYGCTNFSTNRAFVLAKEAAHVLCGGGTYNKLAVRLLRLAIAEIKAVDGRNF